METRWGSYGVSVVTGKIYSLEKTEGVYRVQYIEFILLMAQFL